MSDFLRPYALQPARLLCPWDTQDKNTGVGCHALLQGIGRQVRTYRYHHLGSTNLVALNVVHNCESYLTIHQSHWAGIKVSKRQCSFWGSSRRICLLDFICPWGCLHSLPGGLILHPQRQLCSIFVYLSLTLLPSNLKDPLITLEQLL